MRAFLYSLLLSLAIFSLHASSSAIATINTKEAKKAYDKGTALFLDARGLKLYQKGTITGAMYAKVEDYATFRHLMPYDKGTLLVTFCNGIKCEKSTLLAEKLIRDGYTNVVAYLEGYPAWSKADYPQMAVKKECAPVSSSPAEVTLSTVNGVKVAPGEDAGTINGDWLKAKLDSLPSSIHLVDVRKNDQFKEGHLKGALNVPFDSEKSSIDAAKIPKDGVVIVYCNTGMMSTDARVSLKSQGYDVSRVFVFDANIDCKGTSCEIEVNEPLGL